MTRAAAILAALGIASVLAAGVAASAQTVPSATGELTRAPRSVARGGATVETAPAARDKARMHRRTGVRAAARTAPPTSPSSLR